MGIGLRAQIQHLAVSFNAIGDQIIVPAVAGQRVSVIELALGWSGGQIIMTPKDGVGGTALMGPLTLLNSFNLPKQPDIEWFTTTAGNAFVLNSSAAFQVGGEVWFIQN